MNETDLMELAFTSRVTEWRGPAPGHFAPVPDQESDDAREVAATGLPTGGDATVAMTIRL